MRTLTHQDLYLQIYNFLKGVIDQHKNDEDLDNPKDLIDEYLREMRDREEEGNNEFCRKGGTVCNLTCTYIYYLYYSIRWILTCIIHADFFYFYSTHADSE